MTDGCRQSAGLPPARLSARGEQRVPVASPDSPVQHNMRYNHDPTPLLATCLCHFCLATVPHVHPQRCAIDQEEGNYNHYLTVHRHPPHQSVAAIAPAACWADTCMLMLSGTASATLCSSGCSTCQAAAAGLRGTWQLHAQVHGHTAPSLPPYALATGSLLVSLCSWLQVVHAWSCSRGPAMLHCSVSGVEPQAQQHWLVSCSPTSRPSIHMTDAAAPPALPHKATRAHICSPRHTTRPPPPVPPRPHMSSPLRWWPQLSGACATTSLICSTDCSLGYSSTSSCRKASLKERASSGRPCRNQESLRMPCVGGGLLGGVSEGSRSDGATA